MIFHETSLLLEKILAKFLRSLSLSIVSKNRISQLFFQDLVSQLQKDLEDRKNEIKSLDDLRKKEIKNLESRIRSLDEYVKKLEEIAPVTKLKKLVQEKPVSPKNEESKSQMFEVKNETTKIENKRSLKRK